MWFKGAVYTPVKRWVSEKEKLLESAAGVALSSGLIQVSVRAMRFSLEWLVMEVMKSALLTADWQFHRPIEKESNVLADIGKVRRLLGLRCLQCVMRGLWVVVIVLICKHIVRIGYKNENEV